MPRIVCVPGGAALPVVEVEEHRGAAGDGAEHRAERAEDVRPDRRALEVVHVLPYGSLAGEHVEVVEPEVDEHLLDLALGRRWRAPASASSTRAGPVVRARALAPFRAIVMSGVRPGCSRTAGVAAWRRVLHPRLRCSPPFERRHVVRLGERAWRQGQRAEAREARLEARIGQAVGMESASRAIRPDPRRGGARRWRPSHRTSGDWRRGRRCRDRGPAPEVPRPS